MKKRKITIPVGERGTPLGEAHHNAKLTDEEVETIRDLHEEGLVGYRALAWFYGVTRSCISEICRYTKRATTPERYKTVHVEDDKSV